MAPQFPWNGLVSWWTRARGARPTPGHPAAPPGPGAARRRTYLPGLLLGGALAALALLLLRGPGPGPADPAQARPADAPLRQATATLPPIRYPTQRAAWTDLNPLYAPFVAAAPLPGWTPRVATSYDRSGGNDDFLDYPLAPTETPGPSPTAPTPTPTPSPTAVVLLDVEGASGVLTRLWLAAPVGWNPFAAAQDDLANTRLYIYAAPAPATPLALDLNRLLDPTVRPDADYPLVVDDRYSSGGIVIYNPIVFAGRLTVLVQGKVRPYFQASYAEVHYPAGTPTPTAGWVEAAPLETLQAGWQPPDALGRPADEWSDGAQRFQGVTPVVVTVALPTPPPSGTPVAVPIFDAAGAGTIVKIAFPAPPDACPGGKSPFTGLSLRARYSDTAVARVDLPLDLLFPAPDADFVPALPPAADLDALAFAPTGQHIIVQGDTAWILEPLRLDLFFQDRARPFPDNVGAGWYRVSVAQLLAGAGPTPPPAGLDSYSLRALRDTSGTPAPGGQFETAIQGGNYWARAEVAGNWWAGTLGDAWGRDVNPPPTADVEVQAFHYDYGPLTPTPSPTPGPPPAFPTPTPTPPYLDHWVLNWCTEAIPFCSRYWVSKIPQPPAPTPNTWEDRALNDRLLPFYQSAGAPRVDAFTVSPLGEIFVSGEAYWFCPASAGEDCANSKEAWGSPTPLSAAWWTDQGNGHASRVYGNGALFFGYDAAHDEYYLTFPMPYQDGIALSLVNAGPCAAELAARVEHTAQTYGEGSGYFDARYVQGSNAPGGYSTPLPPPWDTVRVVAATLTGEGKLVGVVVSVTGALEDCGRTFLEGDEHLLVDGTYAQHGTGLEDFFNGGWYFIHGPFYLPTHGAFLNPPNRAQLPHASGRCVGPGGPYPYQYLGEVYGQEGAHYTDTETRMYRFLLNDAVRFDHALTLAFELTPCPPPAEAFTATLHLGQEQWQCRADQETRLGLLTLAYRLVPPHAYFLPLAPQAAPPEGLRGYPPPPEAPLLPPDYPPPPGLSPRPTPAPTPSPPPGRR